MSLLDTPPQFTREEKLKAIERELGYRKTVYPRRVGEKKMSQKAMDFQIAIFEAIAEDYRQDEPTARDAGDARATLKTAIISAIATTSPETGLVAGPKTDALVAAVIEDLSDPAFAWALRVIGNVPR